MKPLARTDRLIKQVVDQDTLVYDSADDSASCLNALASLVWRHCDGQHSVQEIAAAIKSEVELPYGVEVEDAVWEVVDELAAHGLLVESDAIRMWTKSVQRRDVVRMLAALPIFPAIQALTAPSVKSTTSPGASPTPTRTPPASPTSTPTNSVTPTVTPTPTLSQSRPKPTPTPTPSSGAPAPQPTPTPSSTISGTLGGGKGGR